MAPPSATALADVSYVSTVLMALVGGYLTMRPGLAAWIEKNPIVHYGLVVFFLSAGAVSVGAAWWSNLKIDQEHSSETADLNSRISALEAGQKRDQTQHANIIAAVRHTAAPPVVNVFIPSSKAVPTATPPPTPVELLRTRVLGNQSILSFQHSYLKWLLPYIPTGDGTITLRGPVESVIVAKPEVEASMQLTLGRQSLAAPATDYAVSLNMRQDMVFISRDFNVQKYENIAAGYEAIVFVAYRERNKAGMWSEQKYWCLTILPGQSDFSNLKYNGCD